MAFQATKQTAPPAEKPKSEAEKGPEQQIQKKATQTTSIAAIIEALVAKDGGAQKHEEKQEIRRGAADKIMEQGIRERWGQESLEYVVAARRKYERDGNLQEFSDGLFHNVPELSDPANVKPRAETTGILGETAIRIQEIDGTITKEQADALVREYWGKMDQVKTWDDYRRVMPEANGIVARSGTTFRVTGTVSLGFSSSASSVPRVVGTQLTVGRELGKMAVGGQIEAARKLGGSYGRVRLGESEQEEGFLMAGGDARKTPTTREDAGQLDVRLANLAASVLAETLEEDKGRIGNNVAEARSGRFAS